MTSIPLEGERRTDRIFSYFLIGWVLVSLIQAYFSDVSGEEAYYWLFSQYPAWGYLDHPPFVAFFTAPGYWLIPNALGLRLGMIFCSTMTFVAIRKTVGKEDDRLLIWILLGLLMVHVGALLVKTDVPLLMFVAWYFYFYKRYLENDSLKTTFWLAFCIAGIMLSKHHGFLVVIFTVISNPNLFKRKSFWGVVLFTTVLMIPHTIWQFQNDFATIKFHLYNRIDMGFSFGNILYYLGIQPVVFGPIIGVLVLAACYRNRVKSDFNRALKYVMVGVLLFFLISTFKVEFHKHWTSVLIVPIILLSYEYIKDRANWRKWLVRLSIASVVIAVLARAYLIHDYFPKSLTKDWDVLHHWDTWGEEVKELSQGLPVVFINHYERSSRYSYLTGDLAHCYNTFDYRETQHDLWPTEENLQGRKVFIIDRHNREGKFPTYMTQIGKGIHYRVEEDFRSFRKVNIEITSTEEVVGNTGEEVELTLLLKNNYDRNVDFGVVGERQLTLNAHFLKGLEPVLTVPLSQLEGIMAQDGEREIKVRFQLPSEVGKYDLRFSIEVEGIEPPINSKKYKTEIN